MFNLACKENEEPALGSCYSVYNVSYEYHILSPVCNY